MMGSGSGSGHAGFTRCRCKRWLFAYGIASLMIAPAQMGFVLFQAMRPVRGGPT